MDSHHKEEYQFLQILEGQQIWQAMGISHIHLTQTLLIKVAWLGLA